MTANETLVDLAVRHQLLLTRLQSHESAHLLGFILEMHDDLTDKLQARLKRVRLRGYDRGPQTTKRLKLLLAGMEELTEAMHERAYNALLPRLVEIGRDEMKHAAGSLLRSSPVKLDLVMPHARTLTDIALSEPMNGLQLRGWFDTLTRSQVEGVDQAVRLGIAEGETTDQIVRRVAGNHRVRRGTGVLGRARRQAAAIVRTSVNHVATRTRDKVYERNASVVKGVRIVATLDTRTSDICQARDGRVFPVDKGPRPPFHINCRTTTVPVLKSWREMGIDLQEAPEGTRASMNGQVPAKLTYGSWLRTQAASIQDEALGATRGRLFRQGKMDVTRFVDRQGRTLTLDELRRREADVFDAVGL